MNYFELFDLPIAPVVDRTIISRKYFELQKKYHPDFYNNVSDSEKEEVMLKSAEINKGFRIFSNPEKTIEYFLNHTGVIKKDEKYELPPLFLMEMMELNETLTEKEPAEAKKEITEYGEELYNEISVILNNYSNPAESIKDLDLQRLKEYYYKKKYLQRILDRLGD